jgi:PAS domain S-box-containing protein
MKQFSLVRWFKNVSIARKLYFTVGIMAALIAVELAVLTFSINTLSSVRAYVGGEGLWSKAQKDAIYNLKKYVRTHDELYYDQYVSFMKVPAGDHKALVEMEKKDPDKKVMWDGLIAGRNHPDDVDGMIKLFRRFSTISYLHDAIAAWQTADSLANEFTPIAEKIHSEIKSGNPSQIQLDELWTQIEPIVASVTVYEDMFSYKLGEGSRWLENLILKLLFVVALTVELTGLILAIMVSKNIQKGLNEILQSAKAVTKGDFTRKAKIFSKDEIGILANNFNAMADELQKSIQDMEHAQQKFRSLLESAPDAMVIVDRDNVIQLVNKQCENIFGYTKEELLKQKASILLWDSYRNNEPSRFFAELQKEKTDAIELICRRKNGDNFPVEISLRPIETEEGLLLSLAIRDISEKKQMENEIREVNITLEKKVTLRTSELQSKNRELEQFAYVASHDLQEPLRTTSSFLALLRKQYYGQLDAKADKYIDYITQASDRMKTLIMDLLDYSRLGREKQLVQLDCNVVMSEIIEDLENVIRENNAAIEVDPLPIVNAYPTEIKLLFQNLISNSIKFRKEGISPVIKISAIQRNGSWQFAVTDNGIGIEKQYHEKIFIIFQRLHNRSEYDGSGIGLAHCKKIVEMHRGHIWVDSEPGQGSTFHFTIFEN